MLAAPSLAHADTYVLAGIGKVPDVGGDFDKLFGGEDRSSAKLGVGYRFGKIAIEGSVFGANLTNRNAQPIEYGTTSMGAEVKYFIPITGNLEGAVHGGLHKTWFGTERGASTHDGTGTLLGLGLQYGFRLPIGSAAVWLDYTRQGMKLQSQSYDISGSVGTMMLGLSIGI